MRIRQSTLELAKCLHRFKRHEIDGLPSPDTDAKLRGTDFHELHRLYVDHLVETNQMTDFQKAEELCENALADAASLFLTWSRNKFFEPDVIYGTEINILLHEDFTPAPAGSSEAVAPYGGTLDRVEIRGDEADIHDCKTNFAIFTATTVQSMFYPWLLHKLLPYLKKIRFHLDFVRFGTVHDREFTVEEIDAAEVEIVNQVKRIKLAQAKNEWPAMINQYCSSCVLKCPLVDEGLERDIVGQLANQSEAAAMARQLYAMQARAEQMQKTLKQWVSEHGQLDIDNGIRLGIKKVTKLEYPAKAVQEANAEHGLAPARALRGDSREIQKIGRRNPGYIQTLQKSVLDRSTSKLEFIRADADTTQEEDDEAA